MVSYPLHDEFPFGAIAAANVLKDENVTVGNHLQIASELAAIALGVVDRAVRRALEDNRKRLSGVFRRVDFRMQLDAIACGNHRVRLVETLRIVRRRLLLSRTTLRQKRERCEGDQEEACETMTHETHVSLLHCPEADVPNCGRRIP
ncbi:MAG: hypothetical protein AUI53_01380 [Acidobacteria bacterium 13_1_40CM_2_60_7]|nr:MAG: hypothetical protein AUI53_01380 [Acidobacteria bacterium 13_1_40CM_2_60_7]